MLSFLLQLLMGFNDPSYVCCLPCVSEIEAKDEIHCNALGGVWVKVEDCSEIGMCHLDKRYMWTTEKHCYELEGVWQPCE